MVMHRFSSSNVLPIGVMRKITIRYWKKWNEWDDPTIFQQHTDAKLRVWFSDGVRFQLVVSVPAMSAGLLHSGWISFQNQGIQISDFIPEISSNPISVSIVQGMGTLSTGKWKVSYLSIETE